MLYLAFEKAVKNSSLNLTPDSQIWVAAVTLSTTKEGFPKFSRKLPPCEVILCENSDSINQTFKRKLCLHRTPGRDEEPAFYFQEIGPTGRPLKKFHGPFDLDSWVGFYRNNADEINNHSLHVFINKQEAEETYVELCDSALQKVAEIRTSIAKRIDDFEVKLLTLRNQTNIN